MTDQTRNTAVISVSLPPQTVKQLDGLRRASGQTRSRLISHLINRYALKNKWKEMRAWGAQTAHQFKITSEDDIDRILHAQ